MSAVRSPYTKGEFYEFARVIPGEASLFSMRDEERRKVLKAKLAPGVSYPDASTIYAVQLNVSSDCSLIVCSTAVKISLFSKLALTDMLPYWLISSSGNIFLQNQSTGPS